MDLDALSRHELQQLCKTHNIRANLSSKELITLLQSHLDAVRPKPAPVVERTRAGRTPSTTRPLSHPTVPDEPSALPARTREASRRSRATSRSASVATPSVHPEQEAASTVESEKENKRDPVRRKARESQKRLGVGKPRLAGGGGARTVTRIVPSRGSATGAGGRTRSRADPVEEASRMEVVIEEEGESQPNPTENTASNDSTPSQSSQPGTSQPDVGAITRRISAIEAQITQLFTARDTLLSKLAAQERDVLSLRDDIIVDRSKIISDAVQLVESRFQQQLAAATAERSETLKLLDLEKQRVTKLEGHVESLLQRLDALEARSQAPVFTHARDVSQAGLDPAEFLNLSSNSQDDFAPALAGTKRPIEDFTPARASKRARHEPHNHTYQTAARLEDALAHAEQPVSPASAPAASSSSSHAHTQTNPPPAPQTPRTPPLTRHARRQLAIPPSTPGGPQGSVPTPAQIRMMGGMPPSPTTDSPRKGMKNKGKGREGSAAPMLMPMLTSPAKIKNQKAGQASGSGNNGAASGKTTANAVPPAGVTAPAHIQPQTGSALLGATPGPSAPIKGKKPSANAEARGPSTSPAFPPFVPPSRYNRPGRAGPGAGLGLGRPSAAAGSTGPSPAKSAAGAKTEAASSSAASSSPPPTGLLPAFSFSLPRNSAQKTSQSTQSHTNTDLEHEHEHDTDHDTDHTTPGVDGSEIMYGGVAEHQEPITPLASFSESGLGLGLGTGNDNWLGVGFTSPEDGPPSPGKRTLYGTEVLPSQYSGGVDDDEDWRM